MSVTLVRAMIRHILGGVKAHTGPAPQTRIDRVDYDAYWRNRGLTEPREPDADDPWNYPRYEAIASLLPPNGRVVDLGCGDGSLLAFLRNRGWRNLIGVDVSPQAVASLQANGYDAIVGNVEGFQMEALGDVDAVVLSEVLEHVIDFEGVLAAVAAHAPLVVISHPNIGFWVHRLRLLTGRFPIQWGWHPGEHVRFLTVTDLREHLDRSCYETVAFKAPVGVPSKRMRERWPNLLADHIVVAVRR